jgi:hypothetical protein
MKGAQRGAALLAILMVLAAVLSVTAVATLRRASAREPMLMAEQRNLALAAAALRSHAFVQRCRNPARPLTELLPCPDAVATEGEAAPSCAANTQGWLPWKTLGLPPLRDRSGTCFWYERQGTVARVIAAGGAGPGQGRAVAGTRTICGGNFTASSYVDAGDTSLALQLDTAQLAARCP